MNKYNKVTLAIPCMWSHFKYMKALLESIRSSSMVPEEIVISISDVNVRSKKEQISFLFKSFKNDLNIVFTLSEQLQPAYTARDTISPLITGDLIIYHDADDMPHYNRFEYIKRFFEEYDIVHLNHSYRFFREPDVGNIKYDDIKVVRGGLTLYESYFGEKRVHHLYGSPYMRTAIGPTSIKKEVLSKVSWKNRRVGNEDNTFCLEVLQAFKKSMLIDAKIYSYNH